MGKHKGIRPKDKPTHKNYNSEKRHEKNKARRAKKHEARVKFFESRREDNRVKTLLKKAYRILTRIKEEPAKCTHLRGELIQKARDRQAEYHSTGTITV